MTEYMDIVKSDYSFEGDNQAMNWANTVDWDDVDSEIIETDDAYLEAAIYIGCSNNGMDVYFDKVTDKHFFINGYVMYKDEA